MTEPAYEQRPPWWERVASRPRLLLLGWSAALLFSPFVCAFLVYRALDATYQNARSACAGYASYAECSQQSFEILDGETAYHCQVDRENPIPDTSARRIVERLGGTSHITVPLSSIRFGITNWFYEQGPPLFRQGFEIDKADIYRSQAGAAISSKVREHCDEQRIHFLRDEPVEPIAIYDEVRGMLQETVRRFDEATVEYERIRFLFGFLMWGWAAFELVGVVLFLGVALHAR